MNVNVDYLPKKDYCRFEIDDLDGGYYLPHESSEEAGEDVFSWNVYAYYKRIGIDPFR